MRFLHCYPTAIPGCVGIVFTLVCLGYRADSQMTAATLSQLDLCSYNRRRSNLANIFLPWSSCRVVRSKCDILDCKISYSMSRPNNLLGILFRWLIWAKSWSGPSMIFSLDPVTLNEMIRSL